MTDPGLPLTTGEGHAESAEAWAMYREQSAERAAEREARIAAEAECGRLREQLDAARQALEAIVAMHPVDSGLRGADVARAALGVEGPAAGDQP